MCCSHTVSGFRAYLVLRPSPSCRAYLAAEAKLTSAEAVAPLALAAAEQALPCLDSGTVREDVALLRAVPRRVLAG